MKCVAVGDIFITPDMMKKAVEKQGDIIHSCEYFYFGSSHRKEMRDVVKLIESGKRNELTLPDGLEDAIEEAEILMVHLCPVTEKLLDKAKNLKAIFCNRGGIENVDVAAATDRRIAVFTNPAHNANAVAEYTVGLMLCECRNIVRSHMGLKSNVWREKYPNSVAITEMKDLTIGIVGFGNVGELVCEKLSGFGCNILISNLYKPEKTNKKICWDRTRYVEMDELLETSDIVSLHARSANKKVLFGTAEFEKMKPTAYFINTSRSYMVDHDALYDALLKKEICGAAIDVFDKEPLDEKEPLLLLDNVTLTNHRGGDTINSYADSPDMMFNEFRNVLRNGKAKFWVNAEATSDIWNKKL